MLINLASAEGPEGLVDFIPGISEWYKAFSNLGPTWLMGNDSFSFTHVVTTILSMGLVAFLAMKAWKKFKPEPDAKLTCRTFFEMIFDLVMGLLVGQMGEKKAKKYFPLIATLAVFILFSNIFALIPGFSPATDNLNTNIGLAFIVFFVSQIAGIREHGFVNYFKEFLGPIRTLKGLPLMILMFPIEIIGQIVRPFTLSIRLMGNMFGDHATVAVLMTLCALFIPAIMMCLGCLVVVIQTMVFCILSTVYISMAVAPHH